MDFTPNIENIEDIEDLRKTVKFRIQIWLSRAEWYGIITKQIQAMYMLATLNNSHNQMTNWNRKERRTETIPKTVKNIEDLS